jgi:hypothetical protein
MLGDHDAARSLLEDTLTRQRRTLGHDHTHTLATASELDRLKQAGKRRFRL